MADHSQLGLARVARETVQERVYAKLRDQLMRGAFEPGQKLKVGELAKAMGTSHMPIRHALNRLVQAQALESAPNRSVRVPSLSRSSLEDLMEMRIALEGRAIERACGNMTRATLKELRDIIAAQKATDTKHSPEASALQNRAFHFTLYRQSGSLVLLPLIESLWLQCGPYLRVASERYDGRHHPGTEFHEEILAALAARDPRKARAALEPDITRAFELALSDQSLWAQSGGAA